MCTSLKEIQLTVVNTPTILTRVIQILTRRRLPIKAFHAEVTDIYQEEGRIHIQLHADNEQVRLAKQQFEKLVDVVCVCDASTQSNCL